MYGEPAGNSYIVTPSDGSDLVTTAKYLLVANTSSVVVTFKITDLHGVPQVQYLPAGQYWWGQVTRVWATGLTAGTQITAFY